jgi:hypothetical protein
MKKQKAKKAGGKKEDKSDSVAEAPKAEEEKAEVESNPPPEVDTSKEPEGSESKDADEAGPLLENASHGQQPSPSVKSKMRSSSFRASGSPLSPGHSFSPDGDTAPDIYRKQAIRIEELEKENKRLAKEASDGEKRWKKAEEELEDIREAEGESTKGKDTAPGASLAELEKLVSSSCKRNSRCPNSGHRKRRMQLFNDRLPNSKQETQGMVPLPPYPRLHRQTSKPLYNLRIPPSSPWRSKSLIFEPNWIV